jgi:transcriptional regulator with XRE-family HTH domain
MSTTYNEEEKEYLKKIGHRIRDFRIDAGLSQEKLGFACDLDRTYIGSVERGERNISVLNLRNISEALKLRPEDLLNIKNEQRL